MVFYAEIETVAELSLVSSEGFAEESHNFTEISSRNAAQVNDNKFGLVTFSFGQAIHGPPNAIDSDPDYDCNWIGAIFDTRKNISDLKQQKCSNAKRGQTVWLRHSNCVLRMRTLICDSLFYCDTVEGS